MRYKMEFYDDTTNMIAKLSTLTYGLARQGLQQAGSKVHKRYRQLIEQEEATEWGAEMFNSKKFVTHGGRKKNFGDMYGRDNTAKQVKGKNLNLKHYVKWYLNPNDPTAMYVVVAGGHPSFYPLKMDKGVVTGRMSKVPATGKDQLGILQKQEDGHKMALSHKVRRMIFENQDKYMYKRGSKMFLKDIPKVVEYKARNFSSRAFSQSRFAAITTVTKLYKENFPEAVNNLSKKVKEVRIATA